MNTPNSTPTPDSLRAEARAHEEEAFASFERCDTDGFLSQWASGLMAEQRRMEADLMENGGTADFPALFTLSGEMVPARLMNTRYGTKFAVYASPAAALSRGDVVAWVDPFPARESTLTRKGYRLGYVRVPARVEMRGGSATTVRPVFERTDGGYSPDAMIVDGGVA